MLGWWVIIVIPVIGVRIDVPISHSKHECLAKRANLARTGRQKRQDPKADTKEAHRSRADNERIVRETK